MHKTVMRMLLLTILLHHRLYPLTQPATLFLRTYPYMYFTECGLVRIIPVSYFRDSSFNSRPGDWLLSQMRFLVIFLRPYMQIIKWCLTLICKFDVQVTVNREKFL